MGTGARCVPLVPDILARMLYMEAVVVVVVVAVIVVVIPWLAWAVAFWCPAVGTVCCLRLLLLLTELRLASQP